MINKRNLTLDMFKLLSSYMVVFIHVLFYGPIGVAVDALARFAVPLFFLVSGYFSYKITPDKIKDRAIHILKLFAFARITYTIIEVVTMLFQSDMDGVREYFLKYVSLKQFVELIIFNEPIHTGHLWYLFSMFYVYLIFMFVTKRNIKDKTLFSFSIVLLCMNLILGEVFSGFGVDIPVIFIRNFALTGLPFFTLGLIVKKYQQKLLEIPNAVIWLSAFVGVSGVLLSRLFLGQSELYVGSLVFLFAIVLFFVKYSNIKVPDKLIVLFDCSTYIYILHIAVASNLLLFYNLLNVDYKSSFVLQMVHPIIVCVISTFVSYLVIIIKKFGKNNILKFNKINS